MSNYNSLKTTIDANIKQNGRQEITGQILNSVLNQMVTTLGAGYQFAGVATTATNPGTPDAKVFYIANGKGKYTNFGGLEVTEDDVVVLYWDSSWHKVSTGIASQEKLTELKSEVDMIGLQALSDNATLLTESLTYICPLIKNSDIYSQVLGKINVRKGQLYEINLKFEHPIEANIAINLVGTNTSKEYTIGVTATSYIIRVSYPQDDSITIKYSTVDPANDKVSVSIKSNNALIPNLKERILQNESIELEYRVLEKADKSGSGEVEFVLPSPIYKGRLYKVKTTIPANVSRIYTRKFDSEEDIDKSPLYNSPLYDFEWTFIASNNADRLLLYMSESVQYSIELIECQIPTRKKLMGTFTGNGSGDQFFDLKEPIKKGKHYAIFVNSASTSTNQISTSWNEDKIDNSAILYFSLKNYEFNFIATSDANKVCLYNGKTSQYSIEVYEILSLVEKIEDKQDFIAPRTTMKPILYSGDDKSSSNFISNGIALNDGNILVGRPDGKIIKIEDSNESVILDLSNPSVHDVEWRLFFKDSKSNIYVSPAEFSGADLQTGIYRKSYDSDTFTLVKSLNGQLAKNDVTIWTMTEDKDGNLYAGVYAISEAWPIILKSTDEGVTWSLIFDFRNLNEKARHIHWIEYSPWADALYCIVGEINTIYKSIDGGKTWIDLKIELSDKGCGAICTENGIIIGTDSSRQLELYLLRYDDITLTKVFQGWANMCFSIRRSDFTGYLYAFSVIDVSALEKELYPPLSVFDLEDEWVGIEQWKNELIASYGETLGMRMYNNWYAYYESVKDEYPDDAIVPRHYAILYSDDGGLSWKILKRWFLDTSNGGINNASLFFNGECLVGRQHGIYQPVIISEGKHIYKNGGCDVAGEVYAKTNANKIVQPL